MRENRDFGYVLLTEFWHREIEQLKQSQDKLKMAGMALLFLQMATAAKSFYCHIVIKIYKPSLSRVRMGINILF